MLAKALTAYGYPCRRGQQFCGADGSADVVGLKGIHMECKFVESLDIKAAMRQSVKDAGEWEIPVVMHKKSRKPWYVTMLGYDFVVMVGGQVMPEENVLVHLTLVDWLSIYKQWEAGNGRKKDVCKNSD